MRLRYEEEQFVEALADGAAPLIAYTDAGYKATGQRAKARAERKASHPRIIHAVAAESARRMAQRMEAQRRAAIFARLDADLGPI